MTQVVSEQRPHRLPCLESGDLLSANSGAITGRSQSKMVADARLLAAAPALLTFAQSVVDDIVLGGSEIGAGIALSSLDRWEAR